MTNNKDDDFNYELTDELEYEKNNEEKQYTKKSTWNPLDIEWTDDLKHDFCINTPEIFHKCFLDYFNYEIAMSMIFFWGGISIATSWYVWSNYEYCVESANYWYNLSSDFLKCSITGSLFT